jgi:hypothetical protein
MFRKLIYPIIVLLLCSSCVSRTTYKEPGLKGAATGGKNAGETKIIWIWDKDF